MLVFRVKASVLVRVLCRSRTNRMCVYIQREIHFKELTHRIVET